MGIDLYICEDCGLAFNGEDADFRRDECGNRWIVCPSCKSDFIVEAENCRECGETFKVDDLHEGVCEDCVNDLINDEENVIDYIAERGFDDFWEVLKGCYTEHALVKVLYKEFTGDAEDFCKEDIIDFVAFCEGDIKRV